jgi:diadenosine tetraphosphatase ApaH/serine/threonine PP2A family protein phosphatase
LHANWPALEAVLQHANGEYEEVICCGDLVGYNPDPGRVVDWVRAHCTTVIRGNHDKVVAGIEGLDWFNEIAQAAAEWTRMNLSQEQIEYLRNLPPGPKTLEHCQIWHGSPRDEDEYVTNTREAAPCFPLFELPLAFFGHTHLQGAFFSRYWNVGTIPAVPRQAEEAVIELDPDTLLLINPGSVGQPRDGDPRAAYAIFDPEKNYVALRRTKYPVEQTVEAICGAGLPEVLAQRLLAGL